MIWKRRLRDWLLGLGLLAALAGLMAWPEEVASAGRDGLALCGNVILPSLFPFFVVSSPDSRAGAGRIPRKSHGTVYAPPCSAWAGGAPPPWCWG